MKTRLATWIFSSAIVGCSTNLYYETVAVDGGRPPVADSSRPPEDASAFGRSSDAACGAPDDPKNCGTCGHSCLGGRCSMGACQPVVLAAGQGTSFGEWGTTYECSFDAGSFYEFCGADGGVLGGPTAIATDGASVFWLTLRGEVMSVPVGGGTATRLATTGLSPHDIAIDELFVYFSLGETQEISRVLKTGGRPVELTPAPSYGFPAPVTSFVVDAGEVYWVDGVSAYRCPSSGCVSAPETLGKWQTSAPGVIAVGGGGVTYVGAQWLFAGDAGSFLASQVTCGKGGALNAPLDLNYYELQADSEDVYALAGTAVVRGSCSTTAGVTFLASGPALPTFPRGLALDPSYAYWIEPNDVTTLPGEQGDGPTAIERCAKTGCVTPEVLAADEPNAIDLAVDGVAVYWTTGDGKVKKLAKPGPSTTPMQ